MAAQEVDVLDMHSLFWEHLFDGFIVGSGELDTTYVTTGNTCLLRQAMGRKVSRLHPALL